MCIALLAATTNECGALNRYDMAKPIFYDPDRARWKRVRRLFRRAGRRAIRADLLLHFYGAAQ